jgi:hypothetical protein
MVNKDNAIFGMIGSPYWTYISTGSILAVLAWSRHKIGAATGKIHFKDLNPLHSLG